MALDTDALVDWDALGDEAAALMRKYYPQLLELAYSEAGAYFDEGAISFDLANPRVKETIDTLAKQIKNVAETTREDVRRWVETGLDEGLSPAKIAEQIRSKANDISPARALMISRTETGTALNMGSLLAYGDAGVTKVEVLDGDEDEACSAANGQVWTLEKAQAEPLAHPNCTRAFSPLVD